CVQGTLWPYSF
nr:immunoglobulin light chain junction region [Macaca mulatta]